MALLAAKVVTKDVLSRKDPDATPPNKESPASTGGKSAQKSHLNEEGLLEIEEKYNSDDEQRQN